MILESPCCKTKYRFDQSRFTGWKSAQVRCRKCGNRFTIPFPDQVQPKTPTEIEAPDTPRETPEPVFVPVPHAPVSADSPPEPTCRSSLQSAGSLEGIAAEGEPESTISTPQKPTPASFREEDLLPFPKVHPEDSPGIHPLRPTGPAGDDIFSVPPAVVPPYQVPHGRGYHRRRTWYEYPRPWLRNILTASAIVVAFVLVVAFIIWAFTSSSRPPPNRPTPNRPPISPRWY